MERKVAELEARSKSRIEELDGLESSAQHKDNMGQLDELQQLKRLWPRLAQDDATKKQLDQLLQQVRVAACEES